MEATTHRINDPLSDVTRKVRRNVIVTSTVALIMVYANLLPAKIDSLGIKFNETHQSILMEIVFYSLIYLLVSFSIYAISDFLKWKISLTDLLLKEKRTELEDNLSKYDVDVSQEALEKLSNKALKDINLTKYKQELSEELKWRTKLYHGPVAIISFIRAFIDFLAPILIGGFTLFKLMM